jgi:phenylacetate-CoA ligase
LLISSRARLSLVEEAQADIDSESDKVPAPAFYETKLVEVWDRARRAVAYRDLGPFSPQAFHAAAITPKDALKQAPWDYVVADLDEAAKYYETTGTSGVVTPTPRTV